MRAAVRRPHRHGAGRPSPAAAGLGAVPVLHGPEPFEPPDRTGTGPQRVGRAGHDRAAARRSGRQGSPGAGGVRDRDRRGLRCGRAQGPTCGSRKKGRLGRRLRLAGAPGRGTLEKDKPPVLGLIQRGGQVVMRMLANVQQKTIQPIIEAAVAKGARIHTDEYDIYARLPAWGYQHKTVYHAHGEYARDENGDGFCEIHVNTMEGTWWLCCTDQRDGRNDASAAWGHAMRTDSGRPSSNMRFRAWTATSTSVTRRWSVRERSLSPITCLSLPMVASTRARMLYPA